MARRKKIRHIQKPPDVGGFIPVGFPAGNRPTVNLLLDEYEAINLCDYELLTQEEAARFMKISRPTFTRIYSKARTKIAKALVENCEIAIEGGKVYSQIEWLFCPDCQIRYSRMDSQPFVCPLCTSSDINFS